MESTISKVMSPMVQYHKQARERIIANIIEADLSKRLLPEVSSVGFLLTHVAETTYFFCTQLFEGPTDFLPKYGAKVRDMGDAYSLDYIRNYQDKAFAIMLHACETLSDEDWLAKVPMLPFTQEMQRFNGLEIVLMHSQHHLGQVSLALKHSTTKTD
jgi:uncharacterized damage-inducible protein DinB